MLANKTIQVTDEFRTNNLSLTPGGAVVEITYKNGKTLSYDKIKNPRKYIQSLSDYSMIASVKVNGEPFNL